MPGSAHQRPMLSSGRRSTSSRGGAGAGALGRGRAALDQPARSRLRVKNRTARCPIPTGQWISDRILPQCGDMNDHSQLPVLPEEAFEPPLLRRRLHDSALPGTSGYAETNARMESLVKDIPGYLGSTTPRPREGWGSPSGTSATPRHWTSGGATPSTARRRSAAVPSGTRATRCTRRRWRGPARITRREVSGNGRQPPDLDLAKAPWAGRPPRL